MTRVRQTGNGQNTITVETEYGDVLVLRIVCECSGVYAVNYTEDDAAKAGQFVDSENTQELYEADVDDRFDGYDSAYEAKETDNSGSIQWVEIDCDDSADEIKTNEE